MKKRKNRKSPPKENLRKTTCQQFQNYFISSYYLIIFHSQRGQLVGIRVSLLLNENNIACWKQVHLNSANKTCFNEVLFNLILLVNTVKPRRVQIQFLLARVEVDLQVPAPHTCIWFLHCVLPTHTQTPGGPPGLPTLSQIHLYCTSGSPTLIQW